MEMINSASNNVRNSIEALVTICTCYPLGVSKQYFYFDDQQVGMEKLVLKKYCQEKPSFKLLSPHICTDDIDLNQKSQSDERILALIEKYISSEIIKYCDQDDPMALIIGENCIDRCEPWEKAVSAKKLNKQTGQYEIVKSCTHKCSDAIKNPMNRKNLVYIMSTDWFEDAELSFEAKSHIKRKESFVYLQDMAIPHCFVCPEKSEYLASDNKCVSSENDCFFGKEKLEDGKCISICKENEFLEPTSNKCIASTCQNFLKDYLRLLGHNQKYLEEKSNFEGECIINKLAKKGFEEGENLIQYIQNKLNRKENKSFVEFLKIQENLAFGEGNLFFNDNEVEAFCKSFDENSKKFHPLQLKLATDYKVTSRYLWHSSSYCMNDCDRISTSDDLTKLSRIDRIKYHVKKRRCIPARCKKCHDDLAIVTSYLNSYKIQTKTIGNCSLSQVSRARKMALKILEDKYKQQVTYCKDNEINGSKICEAPLDTNLEPLLKEILSSERFQCLSQ